VLRKFLEFSEFKREIPTWSAFSVPISVKGDKKFRGKNAPCGDK
jgi:hypothetical protein